MKLAWGKRSLMAAGVVAFVALATRPWQVRSAEPVEDIQAGRYFGSETCKDCHGKDVNGKDKPDARKFIRLDEWMIWATDDKHSIAYSNLETDRGRSMATLLHVADVTKPEVGCIGCHSASVSELRNRSPKGVAAYDPQEGVSCENCHGPYEGWGTPHLDNSFRTKSAEEWTKMGFVDLRSPAGKSEKCLSCHIGNSTEGKVVTHQMYAAGHPPLPSIEIATFTNSIPRHWWLNSERKDQAVSKSLGHVEGQLEQTKLAIVGAAVALKTSLKLLADEAKTGAPGQDWPDYARFDCWSCHHDLKRESWRQARGDHDGPPGRVPVAEWPLALVSVGIDRLVMADQAAGALRAELLGHEKALRDQANARPFGRKAAIAEAAENYAKWIDVLIQKLGASPFDQAVAGKLLRKLVEQADRSTPDYDTARHVAWTIKLLVDEVGYTLPDRSKVDAIVAKLDDGLKLTLPSGRNFDLEKQLPKALDTISDYDPDKFRAQMAELLVLIPAG